MLDRPTTFVDKTGAKQTRRIFSPYAAGSSAVQLQKDALSALNKPFSATEAEFPQNEDEDSKRMQVFILLILSSTFHAVLDPWNRR